MPFEVIHGHQFLHQSGYCVNVYQKMGGLLHDYPKPEIWGTRPVWIRHCLAQKKRSGKAGQFLLRASFEVTWL